MPKEVQELARLLYIAQHSKAQTAEAKAVLAWLAYSFAERLREQPGFDEPAFMKLAGY